MKISIGVLSACALVAIAGYGAVHRLATTARAQASLDPQYMSNGNLIRPKDFHGWTFVGSNLGLSYDKQLTTNTGREQLLTANLGEYHNIYLKPDAYTDYPLIRDVKHPG